MICLGIDTSNYTTSVALYNDATDTYTSVRELLPVPEGGLGLRQSDAVFHHTVKLPQLMEDLFAEAGVCPDLVAVSVRPSEEPDSYMPCFLAGRSAAVAVASAFGLPVYEFSHQAGHVAAALYSAGRTELLNEPFYAFHVSGGTTDALMVSPSAENVFSIKRLGGSLDLKAGQAVDRVGRLLGLPFPAGAALDALANESEEEFRCDPFTDGFSCSFSGVQNQCERMLKNGVPQADIAKYCITYVVSALMKMTDALTARDPALPLVFSGGVTSNSILRSEIKKKYNAVFADKGLASDNAVGIAFLGARLHEKKQTI